MAFDLAQARRFVDLIDLRGTRRSTAIEAQAAANDAGVVFDQAKNQAQIVGSGLFSFVDGVDAAMREAISDCALLAQLHANKQIAFETDPQRWFSLYGEVLANVGWTVQDLGLTDYSADGTQAEVNKQIEALLTVALGNAASAVTIITAAMTALKNMEPDNPWITLWSREVQRANMSRFQIGLVTADQAGTSVSLVACTLSATTAVTQVLFFKWKEAHASFKAAARKASINKSSMTDLGPAIRNKTRAYQADYLSSIKDV